LRAVNPTRPSPAVVLVLAWLAVAAPGCSRRSEPAPAGATQTLQLQQGNVQIYRQGNVYTYRRNNWFFYACGDALRRISNRSVPPPRCILLHIDAHSDAHPAPAAAAPESLDAASIDALEAYTARLSIGAYVFPMLHYGFAEEVYWVQPAISCYQGPEETVAFALEEREGRILPALRAGVRPARAESLTARAYRAEPVARSQDLACAYGYAAADWQPGPFRLHCLSLAQLEQQARAGRFTGQTVLVDLDLDYFGTGGPLHGYGYLLLPRQGQFALGLLGGALPVFWMTPETRETELRRVCDLIARLSPLVIGISESPEHSHREGLPAIVALLQGCLRGVRPGPLPAAQVHVAGSRAAALSPTCDQYVDLGEPREPRLEIEWEAAPQDSLEIALYWDPAGSQDRRMASWRIPGGERRLTLPLRVPAAGAGSLLGPGWDVEIRRARDGVLLYDAGFTLDAAGALLRRALEADGLRDPAHYLSLSPFEIIAEGRATGLAPEKANQILIAHPRGLAAQCRDLSAYRAGRGTIGGAGPRGRD